MDQIVVKPGTAPEMIVTAARYLITFLGGVIVTKGWLTTEQMTQLGGLLLGAVPLVWGVLSARRNKKKLLVTAEAAPAYVAVVTK